MTKPEILYRQHSTKGELADDDWSLYAKFANGDETAFQVLFDRYKNRILNLSYRFVRNREVAEDIAQEVLIKIYEKKAEFHPDTKFSSWVYRVAFNASLDHIKKRKFFGFSFDQRENKEDDAVPISETIGGINSSSPANELEKKELKILVEKAVHNLPEHLRAPIILFQFEKNSYREIAEILRVTEKAVERRLCRAKKILRKDLKHLL